MRPTTLEKNEQLWILAYRENLNGKEFICSENFDSQDEALDFAANETGEYISLFGRYDDHTTQSKITMTYNCFEVEEMVNEMLLEQEQERQFMRRERNYAA